MTQLKRVRNASTCDFRSRSRRLRLSAVTAALAVAGFITFGPAHALLISDATHEPTNDARAGATTGTLADTFQGCVGLSCDLSHGPPGSLDPADFLTYIGLVSGNTYSLTLSRTIFTSGIFVDFDIYRDASTTISQTVSLSGPPPVSQPSSQVVSGLTGVSSLTIGVHLKSTNAGACCEGYSISLALTGTGGGRGVPEPATAVLLAAGLAGALLTRRRKRR